MSAPAETPDAPWLEASGVQVVAAYRARVRQLERALVANPPASPTPFLLGLVVGCVLGGDFVWIVGQLFNGN